MKPKVSVIIPVFNASEYLSKCLDSIIKGTLKEIEIIVVDDGSTDDSLEILNLYKSKYGILVISQSNYGASKARNVGLDKANGEYVGFVDADDWVEPDMFEKMYDSAKLEDADIVFCNIYRNDSLKLKKYIPTGTYDTLGIRKKIFPLLISNLDETGGGKTLRGSTWSKIFRRSLIEDHHIRYNEQLIYNEDGLFCIEATLKAKRYVYLGDSYLYHNRYVPGSLTKRYIDGLWSCQRNMFTILHTITKNNEYDFSDQINKKLFEIAVYCIENKCRSNHLSEKHKIRDIKYILKDLQLRKAIKHITFFKLKRINKLYYISFVLLIPRLAARIAKHRAAKHQQNEIING